MNHHRLGQTEFIAGDLRPWPAGRVILTPEVSQLADRLPAPYEVISFDASQPLLEFARRNRAVVLTSSRSSLSAGERHAGILIVDPDSPSLIDELAELAPLVWPAPRPLSPEAFARLAWQALRYGPAAAVALAFLLATVFGWRWWSSYVPRAVQEQTQRATVSLFVLHPASAAGVHRRGTGAIVGHEGDEHSLILTAAHCVPPPGTPLFVQLYPFDELSTARVLHIYRDPARDLCILKVPRIDAPATLRVRAKTPRRKPTVFIAGLPRNRLTTVRCAATEQVHFELDSTSCTAWRLDAALDPGASGSPVVCRAGHVIGVYVAHRGTTTGYAVSLDELHRFLDFAGFRWLYEEA